MSDLEKDRALFHGAGLAFPGVPQPLASELREQGEWLFSTRKLKTTPYDLKFHVHESEQDIEDYAVLAHSGHSTNSYAIQYCLEVFMDFYGFFSGGFHFIGPAKSSLSWAYGPIHSSLGQRPNCT